VTAPDAPAPDISILLVTSYHGWRLTERCIESLMPQSVPGCRIQIVLVDNDSPDDTPQQVRRYPDVAYLRLDRNYGFAVANNRGVPLCRAPLVFVLNNDTVAPPGAIAALVAAARALPHVDSFAPQMIQLKQPELVDNRGIYLDATAHVRQVDHGRPVAGGPAAREVFGPSGGAALIRRALLDRIGLYDEALFTYIEDSDWACRARGVGARCAYVPESHILHEGSATTERIPDMKLYHLTRNRRIVRRRWLRLRVWQPTWWLAVGSEWYQAVKATRAGQRAVVRRAIRDARSFSSSLASWSTVEARARLVPWIGVPFRPLETIPDAPAAS